MRSFLRNLEFVGILSFYGISTGELCLFLRQGGIFFPTLFSSFVQAFQKAQYSNSTKYSSGDIRAGVAARVKYNRQCATIRNTILYHRLKIPTISAVLYLPTTGTTTGNHLHHH